MYLLFLESLEGVVANARSGVSLVLLSDFNAHVGSDSKTWRSVMEQNGSHDLNPSGVECPGHSGGERGGAVN